MKIELHVVPNRRDSLYSNIIGFYLNFYISENILKNGALYSEDFSLVLFSDKIGKMISNTGNSVSSRNHILFDNCSNLMTYKHNIMKYSSKTMVWTTRVLYSKGNFPNWIRLGLYHRNKLVELHVNKDHIENMDNMINFRLDRIVQADKTIDYMIRYYERLWDRTRRSTGRSTDVPRVRSRSRSPLRTEVVEYYDRELHREFESKKEKLYEEIRSELQHADASADPVDTIDHLANLRDYNRPTSSIVSLPTPSNENITRSTMTEQPSNVQQVATIQQPANGEKVATIQQPSNVQQTATIQQTASIPHTATIQQTTNAPVCSIPSGVEVRPEVHAFVGKLKKCYALIVGNFAVLSQIEQLKGDALNTTELEYINEYMSIFTRCKLTNPPT